jgi:SAM-dependent methyltransferase
LLRRYVRHYAKRLLGRPSVAPPVGVPGADWYDANYRVSSAYASPYWESEYLFLWTILADRIRTSAVRSVLDIGCGSGQFASCLFALTPIERYTGLDFSAEAIALARRACPQGTFVVGDATAATIYDDTPHDILTCTEMLEHVPNDAAVVNRFKSGRRCLGTVPNFAHETHVRHFSSTQEVADRYARFFETFDVWAVHRSPTQTFYLFDGVRNQYRIDRDPA